MILTVHPNPALDKSVVVENFHLGMVARVPEAIPFAGGKAFNFARALKTLGGDPLVVGCFGGHNGRLVQQLADAENIQNHPSWIDSETRTNLTIIDPVTKIITEIYESGPIVTEADVDHLIIEVRQLIPQAQMVVACGSFLRGFPPDILRQLVELAHVHGIPAYVDTYGAQLRNALPANPDLVKFNHHEAADLLATTIVTSNDAFHAAAEVQKMGAKSVIITLGAGGVVGLDADGASFGWKTPQVDGICAVGSGDAFFGGTVAELAQGRKLSEAVRLGVAAGAANVLKIGAGVFDVADVRALLTQIESL